MRGNVLLGYVLAGSKEFPIAHMLPIGNAFRHIQQLFTELGWERLDITIPDLLPPPCSVNEWEFASELFFETAAFFLLRLRYFYFLLKKQIKTAVPMGVQYA